MAEEVNTRWILKAFSTVLKSRGDSPPEMMRKLTYFHYVLGS